METRKNYYMSFYNSNDELIETILIKDVTDHEAEKEAYYLSQQNEDCVDWSVMEEVFFEQEN